MSHLFSTKDVRGEVGTVWEAKYRYTASKTACKPLGGIARIKMPWKVSGTKTNWHYYSGMRSPTLIKQLVYGHGPIVVMVKAGDPYFQAYKSGIYDRPGSVSGVDRFVLLVGWGVKNGRTHWIIKNSWGTGWGENGWMRIYAGENNIGTQPTFLNPSPWHRGNTKGSSAQFAPGQAA